MKTFAHRALKNLCNIRALSSGALAPMGRKDSGTESPWIQKAPKVGVHIEDDLRPTSDAQAMTSKLQYYPKLYSRVKVPFSDPSSGSDGEGPESASVVSNATNKYFGTPVNTKGKAKKKLSPVMEMDMESNAVKGGDASQACPMEVAPSSLQGCDAVLGRRPPRTPLYQSSFAGDCHRIAKQIMCSEKEGRKRPDKRKAEELDVSTIYAEPPPYESTPFKSMLDFSLPDYGNKNGKGQPANDSVLEGIWGFSPIKDGECCIKRQKLSPSSKADELPCESMKASMSTSWTMIAPLMEKHVGSNLYDGAHSSHEGIALPCIGTTQDICETANTTQAIESAPQEFQMLNTTEVMESPQTVCDLIQEIALVTKDNGRVNASHEIVSNQDTCIPDTTQEMVSSHDVCIQNTTWELVLNKEGCVTIATQDMVSNHQNPGYNHFLFQKADPQNPTVSLGCVMAPPHKDPTVDFASTQSKLMAPRNEGHKPQNKGVQGTAPYSQTTGIPTACRALSMCQNPTGQTKEPMTSKIPQRGIPVRGSIGPPLARSGLPRPNGGNTKQNMVKKSGIMAPSKLVGSGLKTLKAAAAKPRSGALQSKLLGGESATQNVTTFVQDLTPDISTAPSTEIKSFLTKPGSSALQPPPNLSSRKTFLKPQSNLSGRKMHFPLLMSQRKPAKAPASQTAPTRESAFKGTGKPNILTSQTQPMRAEPSGESSRQPLPVTGTGRKMHFPLWISQRKPAKPPASQTAPTRKSAFKGTGKPNILTSQTQPMRAEPSGESSRQPLPVTGTDTAENLYNPETCRCCSEAIRNLEREIEELKRQLATAHPGNCG